MLSQMGRLPILTGRIGLLPSQLFKDAFMKLVFLRFHNGSPYLFLSLLKAEI
jgi:hypothetical protein